MPPIDFAGDWQTTFGPMQLTQRSGRIQGHYTYMGVECAVSGKIANGRLVFTYQEPDVRGEGWFEAVRSGRAFAGQFRPDGGTWEKWEGERIGFDGLWNSSFGLMRLIEEGDQVHGYYEVGGSATIAGERKGNQLSFRYREPQTRGRGRFELADGGLSFQGEWRERGETAWKPWQGIRVRPQPNLTWLVVLEAPWQKFLSDQEYSFGHMLREFFARVQGLQVRHRFFTNEAGLRKCCRDLLYIAEPVVLVIATHALPGGISVDGQTIEVAALVDILKHAGNVRALHFSACLLMQDPAVEAQFRKLSAETGVAISGYRTSVDWAASALIEFTFLEMLLSRKLEPAAAATQLLKLLPFAGPAMPDDSVFRAADFTIVLPGDPGATNGRPAHSKPRRKIRR
ncbi:hypothetical protein AYO44_17435 [Planctomycetaceae bacterium SCGC AG-212-F19]|nr:hypothetical protein AYO44_17435 [Planctomycetaceae bacterium SCGC AG-212-F19]